MTQREQLEALYTWPLFAREDQLAPSGEWETWLQLGGRGSGKTRAGAEWIREGVESGLCKRVALVAPTAADCRDVMVEGESGILAISRPDFMPHYEPSKRRLTWPNGAIGTLYSSEKPNRLRGPQHDRAWADEAAAWKYPDETWSNLLFGLRLGDNPQCLVTTTPRPIRMIRELAKDAQDGQGVILRRASTYANLGNLSPKFRRILQRYEGTSIGRQEIHAEILTEVAGALWKRSTIDRNLVTLAECPEFLRVVVAIDPAVTSGEEADDTGISVCALGADWNVYVLRDATVHVSPATWARAALMLYRGHRADTVVGEVNNGGELVELTVRTAWMELQREGKWRELAPVFGAVHASRGKRTRAEPVAALAEQGRIKYVIDGLDHAPVDDDGELTDEVEALSTDHLEQLFAQLCTWTTDAKWSPDRMDALVWAVTELLVDPEQERELVVEMDERISISPF